MTVTLSDYTTGQSIKQWTSPSIPPGAAPQYSLGDIEGSLGPGVTKPKYYSVAVQSGITGYFQHVLWRSNQGTFTNLSTCNMGVRTLFVFGRQIFSEHNLAKAELALVPCRVETWGGCTSINFDDKAPSLLDSLGPVTSGLVLLIVRRTAATFCIPRARLSPLSRPIPPAYSSRPRVESRWRIDCSRRLSCS